MNSEDPFQNNQRQENLIHQLATKLIDERIDYVTNDKLNEKTLNAAQYAIEFKTIKIGSGRDTGHTEAIKMLSEEYVPSMTVVPNSEMIRQCYADTLAATEWNYANIICVPTRDALFKALYHSEQKIRCRYAVCLIDNASLYTKTQLEDLYLMLSDRVHVFAHFQ